MTPPINPAFAKYVVSVKPALPEYLKQNQYKLRNLEAGKTTDGKVRQRGSLIQRKVKV